VELRDSRGSGYGPVANSGTSNQPLGSIKSRTISQLSDNQLPKDGYIER
jgi:hypothetical protein